MTWKFGGNDTLSDSWPSYVDPVTPSDASLGTDLVEEYKVMHEGLCLVFRDPLLENFQELAVTMSDGGVMHLH